MEQGGHWRLEPAELDAIRDQTESLAPGAEAYLFGSRTNPAARGGDIDLLLLTEQRLALGTLRRIRRAILDRIGEQKLDIVNFTRNERHPFKDVALTTAARL
jgi:predicted nucleotidyltransferase